MNLFLKKNLCIALAIATALSSLGCVTTMEHPTQATIGKQVHDGDDIEVVMKSGQRRKFAFFASTQTEIRSHYEEPIAYADIQKIRITHRKIKRFSNGLEDVGDAVGMTVLVIVAIPVTIGIAFCALSAGGGARFDGTQPYNNGTNSTGRYP